MLAVPAASAHAQSLDSLIERLERLERENRELRREIEAVKAAQVRRPPPPPAAVAAPAPSKAPAGFVRTDSRFAYEILDPTDGINRKERLLLDRKRDGTLAPGGLWLQGAITPIAGYQSSDRADKFGFLMRHPTAANRVLATVQKCAYSLKSAGPSATRCRTGAPGVATRQAASRLLRFRYGPSGDEPQPQAQWAFQGRKETSGHGGRIREINEYAVVKRHIYFQHIDAVFDRHLQSLNA